MVSVCLNLTPREMWTAEYVRLADRVIKRVLANCGMAAIETIEDGSITRVVRRQCSDVERRRVVEKYLQK